MPRPRDGLNLNQPVSYILTQVAQIKLTTYSVELLASEDHRLAEIIRCYAFGFKKNPALLEDQLVQLKLCHDLLRPAVLLLQSPKLRQLRFAHTTESLAPVLVGRVADTDTLARRRHIAAGCQHSST